MNLRLAGKTAFIAGASSGLGYAVAKGLLMEGCKVVINSLTEDKLKLATDKLKRESGGSIFSIPGDVTDSKTPDRLIGKSVELLGGLDLLVTNAGGPPPGSFESFDDNAWEKAIDLSFISHVRLIRAALPHLRQSLAASVLTITSYSVKQPIPNLVLSNSIRSATIGLTKTLALEVGKEGIRFNSILPGWTETERVTELMETRAEQKGTTLEEEISLQSRESPLARMATPEEFANAAVFLLSPAASYITGVMLTVDGGMYKGTY
ncbi:SDR family oxidoreductase [Chloroflexota bacterium]